MKHSVFIFWILLFLVSCSAPNRIVAIDKDGMELKNIKLTQRCTASPVGEEHHSLRPKIAITYLFEAGKKDRPKITVDFRPNSFKNPEKTNAAVFLNLENEMIRILSENQDLAGSLFVVPENLWISLVHSQEISYRIQIGSKEMDVKLSSAQSAKLKEFFNRAIQQNKASFPAIPEGQKKW